MDIFVDEFGIRYFVGMIFRLSENQVFVFGSNEQGFHGAGAAGFASFGVTGNVWRNFDYAGKPKGWKGKWNEKGISEGLQFGTEGRSYALPTVSFSGCRKSYSGDKICEKIMKFYEFARGHMEYDFLVAYMANNSNLNGYNSQDMASFFSGDIPENVIFEKEFGKLVRQ